MLLSESELMMRSRVTAGFVFGLAGWLSSTIAASTMMIIGGLLLLPLTELLRDIVQRHGRLGRSQ